MPSLSMQYWGEDRKMQYKYLEDCMFIGGYQTTDNFDVVL